MHGGIAVSDVRPTEIYNFLHARRTANLVFISGQVGMKEDGSFDEDPVTQFRLAFTRLGEVLEAEGLTPANLVELTTYHVDLQTHFDTFAAVKHEFLGSVNTAWTAIGITSLASRPGAIVEIKATAEVI